VTCSKILEDPATETRISEDEMADYYKYDPVPLFFELLPVEGQTLFLTNPFFFFSSCAFALATQEKHFRQEMYEGYKKELEECVSTMVML
jgi:hypothetical protein